MLAGRLVAALADRFTVWHVPAGLAALPVVDVLVVAVFNGPIPESSARDGDTAQGLLNFFINLGGRIGPPSRSRASA